VVNFPFLASPNVQFSVAEGLIRAPLIKMMLQVLSDMAASQSIPQVLNKSQGIIMENAKITSELIRAARALLRWEQRQLAEASSVSLATIKRLEAKRGILVAHASTVAALVHALENEGIEFTNGDTPGVRVRKPSAERRKRRG
jgi:hypothetical protein